MSLVLFLIWLVANNVGGREPLAFGPVNAWTGTLLLAIALDFSAPTRRQRQGLTRNYAGLNLAK